MRSDVVVLKDEVEEKLGQEDETKAVVHQLAQDMLRKLHRTDKQAVIDIKSEAFDDMRHLKKMEEQTEKAILELSSSEELEPEVIETMRKLVLEMEKSIAEEKDYSLSVAIKKSNSGQICDSVYLRNASTDPGNVQMYLDSNGPYIRIKIEPTHGILSEHSLKHITFSARGLKSGKQYQKLLGNNPSMISLHKPDEDLTISVSLFGSNINNSPLYWSNNEKVIKYIVIPKKSNALISL